MKETFKKIFAISVFILLMPIVIVALFLGIVLLIAALPIIFVWYLCAYIYTMFIIKRKIKKLKGDYEWMEDSQQDSI